MAKLTRIEQHAPTIRAFYLRADDCQDDDYRNAMNEMTSFSFTVKNVHDDAADSMAMLADYLANGIKTVSVGKRHRRRIMLRMFNNMRPVFLLFLYQTKALSGQPHHPKIHPINPL